MIPYFTWMMFRLGPVAIRVWGFFAALGLVFGAWYAVRLAKRTGFDRERFETLVFWIVVSAFVGARLFMVVYEPAFYFDNPLEIFRVWHGGLSSFGGFIGATACFLWFAWRRYLPVWETADILIRALPLGLGFGRVGCFLIHDHLGAVAGRWWSFLAVSYYGGPRYDLGLLLSLLDFAIFGLFVWMGRRQRPPGAYVAVFTLIYAPIRFLLDSLRVSDLRYFGLTPAQYGCLALLAVGVWIVLKCKRPFSK